MIPALMFGTISGAQINPAMTIAAAVVGNFPWQDVVPYIVAQLLVTGCHHRSIGRGSGLQAVLRTNDGYYRHFGNLLHD